MTGVTVPGHPPNPPTPARRALVRALAATGVWHLLPGGAQGALCGCLLCRTTP